MQNEIRIKGKRGIVSLIFRDNLMFIHFQFILKMKTQNIN